MRHATVLVYSITFDTVSCSFAHSLISRVCVCGNQRNSSCRHARAPAGDGGENKFGTCWSSHTHISHSFSFLSCTLRTLVVNDRAPPPAHQPVVTPQRNQHSPRRPASAAPDSLAYNYYIGSGGDSTDAALYLCCGTRACISPGSAAGLRVCVCLGNDDGCLAAAAAAADTGGTLSGARLRKSSCRRQPPVDYCPSNIQVR